MGCMPFVWYFAVLGVNTPFKFAVFVREGAAPLPCIKGDRDSDRPWGQISQNQSKNDKKGKIVQRSQLCDHLVGRRDTMNAESNETLPVSEKYMLTIKEAAAYFNIGILVNDAVTREAITKDQMRKFLKFVHDDVVYCKYYEVVYILFHTGMRISEFCGLTLEDIDLENRTINIDHQLQRTSDMRYIIETTKTDAGTRVLPITEDVAQMFQAIIEDRNAPKVEKSIDGYSGFLFYDDNGMPLVAMHWQHRFNHMVGRYNDIYRVQLPNITPHVCRHTYCSNMAKSRMNPKTLQYLMGHSDISVTMNVYTHIGFDDAEEELKRMEEFRKAQAEVEQKKEKPMSQKMFKVI